MISFHCGLVTLAGFAMLAGCVEMSRTTFLRGRDNEIKESTHAIETARDDGQRAIAYSARGVAYSEKARYSRAFKLIPEKEYERVFDLAIQDHDRAVALNPDSAEVYFNRGQAYYDRGGLDLAENKGGNPWFDAAVADFEKATQKDSKNYLAFDRLGLAYEAQGKPDEAIRSYTQEMALHSLGRSRLADVHCNLGFRYQQRKAYADATAAYQRSTEFGTPDSKTCPNEPFAAMVTIYTTETREYDKAWETVHQARKAGQRIAPELIDQLEKASGRRN